MFDGRTRPARARPARTLSPLQPVLAVPDGYATSRLTASADIVVLLKKPTAGLPAMSSA
jgi:hypothetical protein